ncbi:hypothetical protein CK498_24810 [Halomonas salipaludis]|uniref:Uncharacterized protein n=2 Tax=Halomonas salipaludis TaxID=2032625 RepID=A0A2A2EN94_9GAMM|nr:hypothetical protein CK498_24810 [Halomonas salipaludis]
MENEVRFLLPFDFISKILATREGEEKIKEIILKHKVFGVEDFADGKKGGENILNMAFIEYILSKKIEPIAEIWKSSGQRDIIFLSRINIASIKK